MGLRFWAEESMMGSGSTALKGITVKVPRSA